MKNASHLSNIISYFLMKMTNNPSKIPKNENSRKKRKIKVAILAEEPFFWGSRKHYHKIILNNYSWKTRDTYYTISTKYVYDTDIIKGKFNKSNFDVLLIPGGGVGNNQALLKGFNSRISVRRFKKNIANFIRQGGGYVGICGGAALMTDLSKDSGEKPKTYVERQYNKSSLGVSCVSSYFKNLAFPIFYPFQYNHPERIGNSAYAFSFSPGETVDGKYIHSIGCPLDVQIYKNNPIFSDFNKKIECIRWWAEQALIVPEKPDRDVYILARFPRKKLSENESTRIFAWKYIGGVVGILSAIMKALRLVKENKMSINNVPIFAYYLAGDWATTDKIIELNQADKPCMTAEIYPNENKGRIILSSVHAEYMIWRGGHIEEKDDSEFNCVGKGLHQWKNIEKLSDTLEEELTHNWWMIRRFVAWAAKIPDGDLPPQKSKGDLKRAEDIIKNNIFWDGSFINQTKSI